MRSFPVLAGPRKLATFAATTACLALGSGGTAWAQSDAVEPAAEATPATAGVEAAKADDAAASGKGKVTFEVSLGGRVAGERSSAFAVDAAGAKAPDAVEVGSRASLGLRLLTNDALGMLHLEARAGLELVQGVFTGRPTLAGDRRPGDIWNPAMLSEAWAGLSLGASGNETIGLRSGLQLSHWGLGLLANDGRNYLSGDATSWFSLPYVGDRVLRTALWTRPWAGTNSPLRGLLLSFALDRVASDDITLPMKDPGFAAWNTDEVAWQGIFAARMFLSKTDSVGLYYVYRDQQHSDGKWLKVHSADVAIDLGLVQTDDLALRLSGEAVGIFGQTTLGPSPDHPEHKVRQVAGVLRLDTRAGKLRALFDLGAFSGDPSADDDVVSNFKADPNFQQGILLFRRVVGWQTARMRGTASNPDVVGTPNEDLERLASGGSVTSTITLFPRVGARLGPAEVYGGLLLALSPTPIADPYQTRTKGGGVARTVYGKAVEGSLLGAELDGGVRMAFDLVGNTQLLAGVEYGVALPGGAMAGLDQNVHGGRIVLTLMGKPDAAKPDAAK